MRNYNIVKCHLCGATDDRYSQHGYLTVSVNLPATLSYADRNLCPACVKVVRQALERTTTP